MTDLITLVKNTSSKPIVVRSFFKEGNKVELRGLLVTKVNNVGSLMKEGRICH